MEEGNARTQFTMRGQKKIAAVAWWPRRSRQTWPDITPLNAFDIEHPPTLMTEVFSVPIVFAVAGELVLERELRIKGFSQKGQPYEYGNQQKEDRFMGILPKSIVFNMRGHDWRFMMRFAFSGRPVTNPLAY
jgi:hypothetical protein